MTPERKGNLRRVRSTNRRRVRRAARPIYFTDAGGLQGGARPEAKVKLVPLSSYGKTYTPPPAQVDPAIDMKTPVREQVNRMDAGSYFTFRELLKGVRQRRRTPRSWPASRRSVSCRGRTSTSASSTAVAQGPAAAPKGRSSCARRAGEIEGVQMCSTAGRTDHAWALSRRRSGRLPTRGRDYPGSAVVATGKPYEGPTGT